MTLEASENEKIEDNTVHVEDKISRRGLKRYDENPFILDASKNTSQGTRKVSNKKGDAFMIVKDDFHETGEVVSKAGFYTIEEVDKTQFVKLYINGVSALAELTRAGHKVFKALYLEVQKTIGKDRVTLAFQLVNQIENPMSKATFMRGMKELAEKNFIAESTVTNSYFINPDFIFNGDRLSFVKEYRRKEFSAEELSEIENKKKPGLKLLKGSLIEEAKSNQKIKKSARG